MKKKQIIILVGTTLITVVSLVFALSSAFGWLTGGAGIGTGFSYETNLYFPEYNNITVELYQIVNDTPVELPDGKMTVKNIGPGERMMYKLVIDNPNEASVKFDVVFADITGDEDIVEETNYAAVPKECLPNGCEGLEACDPSTCTWDSKPIVAYKLSMGYLTPTVISYNLAERMQKIDSTISVDYANTWGVIAISNAIVPGLATGDNKYVIDCYLYIESTAGNYFQDKQLTINKILFITY